MGKLLRLLGQLYAGLLAGVALAAVLLVLIGWTLEQTGPQASRLGFNEWLRVILLATVYLVGPAGALAGLAGALLGWLAGWPLQRWLAAVAAVLLLASVLATLAWLWPGIAPGHRLLPGLLLGALAIGSVWLARKALRPPPR